MSRVEDALRGVRARVTEMLRDRPESAGDLPSPATPEWRVREVLSHMIGVGADVMAGRLEGVATDPWTAAQVDARRGRTLCELFAEWDEIGPQFEQALGGAPEVMSGQAVFDAITHEQDLRLALDEPGARESDAVGVAFDWGCAGRTTFELPALRFVTEAGEALGGIGEAIATVTASRFEIIRALTGRRTAAEVAAYKWEPPQPPETLLVAPMFMLRATSLNEE
ncbi:MAG: maleylpyruvate isomerase N-terminal domain-containing protein [Actinomycetota bacterium]